MIQIGGYNRLRVARHSDFGVYLTDGTEDVLLPRKFVPPGTELGHELRVFVTTDSEDRPVATTQRPVAVVGEFGIMRTKAVSEHGAFMDWGLDKDLLVPFGEQLRRMEEGNLCVVRVLLDERTRRVVGSTRVAKFLKGDAHELEIGQAVTALIFDDSPEAVRCVLDGKFYGSIFPDEIHERLQVGTERQAYIKRIREDGGIALSLLPQGFKGAVDAGPKIVAQLKKAGGFLPFSDQSPPEAIRKEFGLSKGTFKKAIGHLFKSGQIEITFHGIRLLDKPANPRRNERR